jgi:SH3-like domain-containing protein
MIARALSALVFLAFTAAAGTAAAAEFRSVAVAAAVLYDAPSAKSRRLYVVNHGYPFEVVVVIEGWSKVRDEHGDLTWIESRHLTGRRTLVVTAPVAQIREAAAADARVVFEAQRNVLLDVIEVEAGGWLRVRHRDGESGYVSVTQVWGA